MTQFWIFDNINLFKLLCPHKFKEFEDSHTFLKFKKNDYIYLEEDVAQEFFLITKGKVKIGFWDKSGEETVTAYLKKGEIFGEDIILNQNIRKEFAQAVENNTELYPVTMRQAEELMKKSNSFSISLYKFIGYKFKKIERKYHIMLFRDTRTRAIEFIKGMQEDGNNCHKLISGDIVVDNPYSQSEIAKLIGTSRSTFNLLINELQANEYVRWGKGNILLKSKFLLEF